MSKKPLRQAVLLLLAVFLGGMLVGVVSADYIEELPLPFMETDRDYDDDLEDVIDAEQRLLRRMNLPAEKQQAVERLLQQREDTLVAYWAERIPAMNELIESSRANIRALLDAEQRARYDAGLQELLQARRRDD